MKSILYVAAVVMIGASVYGFIDYSKTSRHKEFKTMYDEPRATEPVVAKENKSNVIAPETASKKDPDTTATEQPVTPVKKIKKKRTLNLASFSRAPLREKRETVILETKEVKAKEQ
jgi:hypothetical protein